MNLRHAVIIDTALQGRRGTILTWDAETLQVTVMWRAGQFTSLRPEDITAGRYQVEVAQS